MSGKYLQQTTSADRISYYQSWCKAKLTLTEIYTKEEEKTTTNTENYQLIKMNHDM